MKLVHFQSLIGNTSIFLFEGEPFTAYQQRENLQAELNTTDFHFVDFVYRCLTVDPRERISPEEVAPLY